MESINILNAISYLKPEIVVSIGLLLIVILDLIFIKDKRIVSIVSLVSIAIAAFVLVNDFTLSKNLLSIGTNSKFGMVSIDPFGAFFKFVILISTLIVVAYTYSSEELLKVQHKLGEYYALLFGLLLGMMVLVSATDLILIYVSIELMSLSSYVLTGFTKLKTRNSEAALKYLLYGGVASGIMLFGISYLYGLAGTTNLYELNSFIAKGDFNSITLVFSVILIFVGIGYKISTVPFHFWAPDVYEGAPISITAILSVASKAAGFAVLVRFVRIAFVSDVVDGTWKLLQGFDWQTFLIVISILTMTVANFTALWQRNLKRLLAYSSIAHAGYILLGLVSLNNEGQMAILIYFFFYLMMNLGAFYIVMLIANKIGSEEIEDYNGLGYSTPFLGVTLSIFLVSLAGLPPTAGFIGKLYIFISVIDAKLVTVAVIAVLNTVVAVYYYMRVLKALFLKTSEKKYTFDINFGNKVIIVLLAFAVLFFGVYFSPIVDLANYSIAMIGL